MPGIEFVGADAEGEADEDVLHTGPRRPWPRWVWVVAGLLALAAVVGVLVASRSDDAPDATPSPSPSPSPSTSDGGSVVSGPQISALTSDGTSLFWLAGARLYRAGPVGRASMSAAIETGDDEFAETQLIADPAERIIWVVSRGSSDNYGPGTVTGFSTTNLSLVSRASTTSPIDGAAVLNGALFVLSDSRLRSIVPKGNQLRTVTKVDRHAHGLVAGDDELYYVEGGNGSALGRWTPAGGVRPAVVLTTTDTSLAVVGATLFRVGTRAGRWELAAEGPAAQALGQRAIAGIPTEQLQIVSVTSEVLLVLGMVTSGLQLVCVEGDGTVADRVAAVSANVAVLHGVVFEAAGDSVRPATIGCP